MNAFGEALNLVFMRGSGDFSSGSMPMDSISGCIPMSSSSYSPANGLNLWMHSHEFLFLSQWIQDCIPMSSYSQPMNLWMHSHEFKSLFPANESQTAFPWVPIPQPMNLRLHSHEFKSLFPANELNLRLHSHESLFPAKFLESFGWVPPMYCHPDSKRAHRSPKNCILARFEGYPYTYHMGTPKIDCRAF